MDGAETSDFIKTIWGKMDKNGSEVIDNKEIELAYKSREFQDFLSKLVCKHKSEWSYDKVVVRNEIECFL